MSAACGVVKIAGWWVYLYRAIDQFGRVIDVLVSEEWDLATTGRFFIRALGHGPSLAEVSTDRVEMNALSRRSRLRAR